MRPFDAENSYHCGHDVDVVSVILCFLYRQLLLLKINDDDNKLGAHVDTSDILGK